MPRVLLLLPATTYRAEAFLEAARRLHLDVTVGSEGVAPPAGPPPTGSLTLDFKDPEGSARTVAAFARHQPIDAVVGVDDTTAVVAAAISAALGLPHNSVAATSAARDKHRMRELLRERGVPVPHFTRFSLQEDPAALVSSVAFPCVVKPLVLSSSCGVIRADNAAEFAAAFRRVGALLTRLGVASRDILVEDFVPGAEVALEGLLTRGELRVLALFDKPDPLDGPFFEETIYVTPSRLPAGLQAEIAFCTSRAARALGLREGPVHGELRVNEKGVWVIEVAARSIGGRCARTLRFGAGMSLEELILRHALRMDLPSLERERKPAGVMMLPIPRAGILNKVRGQKEALKVPGIEELAITAQPGEELVPLPEGTRYLGFLIARGDSTEAVEASLREAHRKLEFEIRAHPTAGPDTEARAPNARAFSV
ncbi:MAG: ATP-grasp domain-containing protein [Nitrospiraceae bacterium]